MLVLLPPGLDELRSFPSAPAGLYELLWQGAYPRIYDRGIPAHQWLADYTATYVQRDVRQILNVGDLQAFTAFLTLCAGRTAQEVNLSALGSDAGVSHNTVRAWLSVLEASYVVHRLPAWHRNLRKQVVKAPKLHFFDSGLLCYLLGIREPAQLRLHPLRGAVFESWVVAELYKGHVHRGVEPSFFHYRESRGVEVDLVVARGERWQAIEVKSGETIARDFFKNLERLTAGDECPEPFRGIEPLVVYGGDRSQQRSQGRVVTWSDVPELSEAV